MQIGFWFLLLVLNVGRAQNEKKYFQLGGALVLGPEPTPVPIRSVLWRSNGDLVVEWDGGNPPEVFGRFKNHVFLNTSTGELTVATMQRVHAGRYEVILNYRVHDLVYDVENIEHVPQPSVEVTPPVCSQDSDSCSLRCEGGAAGAQPVSYFWQKDQDGWTWTGDTLDIFNDEETQRVKTFSCRLENPVSSSESEPLQNPFYSPGPGRAALIAAAVVGLVLAGVGVGVGVSQTLQKPGTPEDLKHD